MDRLDAMQVMLTAVECGSLSAASRKLGQPLATVSRKVSELERDDWLRLLLEPFEPPSRPVHLIYGRRNRLPLKLRAFVDFEVPRLRDRLLAATL